jgi:hypothetical protein
MVRSTKRLTIEEYKSRVFSCVGNEFEVLNSSYINKETRMQFLHKKCGKISIKGARDFLVQDARCSWCDPKGVITTEILKYRIETVTNDEYTLVGEYNGKNTIPVEILHKICGQITSIPPKNFLGSEKHGTAQRCRFCRLETKSSKGEVLVNSILEKYNLVYERQVLIEGCSRKLFSNLSFDFQVFLEDGTFALIEYNGNSHYKPCFGSTRLEREANLKIQQERDKFKSDFCEKAGIPLLIIPYTEFENTERIIMEWFGL